MQSFANAYVFFGLSQAYWTVCCQVFSTVWCFLCNSLCWNTAQLDCHHQKQDCPDAVLWCSVRVMFSKSSPTSGSVIWGEKGRESYPTLISVSLLQWGFIRDQAIRVPALWVYPCDSTRANGYVKWHASNPRSAGHRGGGGRTNAVSEHQGATILPKCEACTQATQEQGKALAECEVRPQRGSAVHHENELCRSGSCSAPPAQHLQSCSGNALRYCFPR